VDKQTDTLHSQLFITHIALSHKLQC